MNMRIERNENDLRQSKHILVIGGAGYIGSALTRKLLAKGFRVSVLDKLIYNNGCALYDLLEDKNFEFINGDFGNEKSVEAALPGVTDVILLAALVGDPICKEYPELAIKTNVEYPQKLFTLLNGRNIKRFIFTSTCSNYGLRSDDSPADEESELNPLSLYAKSKVEFEKFISENSDKVDFSSTILRLSTAFGMSSRMRFDLTISEFTRDLALGKELIVYDENTWRPYCNVSDINNAIIKVINDPGENVAGQVFNIGSDENNYTKQMIVDLIRKYVRQPQIEYKTKGSDPRNYRVSFSKVRELLNFEPRFTAEDSIRHLITAIENNLFSDVESRKNFYGNYYITNKGL